MLDLARISRGLTCFKRQSGSYLNKKIKRCSFLHLGHAFTLSELLMSVLVVSIILVAMAPVITKRTSDNISVNAVKYEDKLFTTSTFESGCTNATDDDGNYLGYTECTLEVPENVHSINLIGVSAGGGGGGSITPTETKNKCFAVPNSTKHGGCQTYLDLETEDQLMRAEELHYYMRNFSVEMQGASGGGGGAAYTNDGAQPSSQEDCDTFGAMYLETDSANATGICIMKKNVGDAYKLGETELVKMGISVVKAGSDGDTCNSGSDCCFMGTTSGTCTESGTWGENSSGYSGCTRTVCGGWAGYTACENYAPTLESKGHWRLPTYAELAKLKTIIDAETESAGVISKYLGNKGLDFCDSNGSMGSIRCSYGPSYCKNASSGYYTACYPYYLLAVGKAGDSAPSPYSSAAYTMHYLQSGKLQTTSSQYAGRYMTSVRCVLDNLGSDKYTFYGGGGGAGGNVVEGYKIPDEIISKNVGGKIFMVAGYVDSTKIKYEDGTTNRMYLNATKPGVDGDEYEGTYPGNLFFGCYGRQCYGNSIEDFEDLKDFFSYSMTMTSLIFTNSNGTGTFLIAIPAGEPGTGASLANKNKKAGKGGSEPDTVSKFYKSGLNRNYGGCVVGYYDPETNTKIIDPYYDSPNTCSFLTGANIYYGKPGTDGSIWTGTSADTQIATGGVGGLGYSLGYDGYNGTNNISGATPGGRGGYFKFSKNSTTGETYVGSFQNGTGNYGYMVMRYSWIFPVGAGGGGQSGSMFEAKNVDISNAPVVDGKRQITIAIGKGGAGGALSTAGKQGGKSGFSFNSNSYYATGGMGGNPGRASSNVNLYTSYFGTGGSKSSTKFIETSGFSSDVTNAFKLVKGANGQKGTISYVQDADGKNTTQPKTSIGGRGGGSPTGAKGGCGGYFSDEFCSNESENGTTTEFKAGSNIYASANYGSAGAGGGGGGWDYDKWSTPGKGGDGQDGYVYVYWVKVE